MIIVICILSFVLDSLISNFIPINSIFCTLFSLMSLILIYPYFNGNHEKYYITSFVMGLACDLIYTDTIIVNAVLFLLIAIVITRLNYILSNNYINVIIMALICIVIFRTITYCLLLMTGNVNWNMSNLLKSINRSIISNSLYVSIGYIITDTISYKLKIKKSN